MKTVSALLMTYNSASRLRDVLRRIHEQDYPDIEIVIADGGSTDGTIDIIKEYETRIRFSEKRRLVWKSAPDQGLYDALNKTIRMSSGDYLIITNDRLLKKDAVSRLVKAAENGGCCGAHADLVYCDKNTVRRYWHMGNSRRIWTGWMPGHPTLLLKREIYDAYGVYRTDYRIAADYEFMMRFLKDGKNRLAYVPEILVNMYYGDTSTAKLSDYIDSFREGYHALRENRISFPFLTTCFRTVRVLSQFRSDARLFKLNL